MTASMRKWLAANAGRLSAAVLVIGIALQTGFLLREYVLPWGWRVKQVWDSPRLVRSADLSLGAQARKIITFIDQVVPEDGRILLPPGKTDERFSLARSMQYFFFPRQLIACGEVGSAVCQQALQSREVYVLATEDFPPDAGPSRTFVAPQHGLGWFQGIYGPAFREPHSVSRFTWLTWLITLAGDTGIVLALALLGAVGLLAIRADWQPLELFGLSVPVGAGMLTLGLFLLSWVGVRLTFGLTVVVFAVLFGALLLVGRRALGRVRQPVNWRLGWDRRRGMWRVLMILAGLGLLGLAVALSVGASYRLYDPVQIWSVKGYGIAQDGSIFAGAQWGVHGLAYPLNIPLQIAIFFMADGDALPGSKLLFPLYGLALCTTVFAFLRRQNVAEWVAGLGALLLGSVPIVFFHATSGFANLPFTVFLVSGVLWAVDGVRSGSGREQFLAGALLGLAAWTRPEGVLYALAVMLILAAGQRVMRQGRMVLATLVPPLVLISGAWFIFALWGHTLQGSNLQQAVSVYSSDTFSGHIDFSGLWTIVNTFTYSMFVPYRAMFPAISATYWGALFPIVLVLMALSLRRFGARRNASGLMTYAVLIGIGVINVAVFYIRSYSKSNFPAFIERAFPRAFLPTAVLMAVVALWGLGLILKKNGQDQPWTMDQAEQADSRTSHK